MKPKIIFACLILAICACNRVKDSNPRPVNIPTQVIKLVEDKYHDAKNLKFSNVVKDKVWNVDFESADNQYNASLNTDTFINTYRLAGNDVPDSLKNLLNPSVITGGVFSNFREETYSWSSNGNYGKTLIADYNWNNKGHLVRWGVTAIGGSITYNIDMNPVKLQSNTLSKSDLPDPMQQYLSDKGLQFNRCTILTNWDQTNVYRVQVSKNNDFIDLYFNNNNTFVAGGDQSEYLTDVQTLPVKIKDYLSNTPEYKGFGFSGQFASIIRKTFDGVVSYQIGIQKHSGTIAGSQAWFITIDQQGDVVLRNYLGLY